MRNIVSRKVAGVVAALLVISFACKDSFLSKPTAAISADQLNKKGLEEYHLTSTMLSGSVHVWYTLGIG